MTSLIITMSSFLFSFVVFFDPSGLMFGLKTHFFLLFLFTFLLYIAVNKSINVYLIAFQSVIILFGAYGSLIGIMNGGDFSFSLSMFSATAFVLCMSPILYYIKYFERSVVIVSNLFVCFLIFLMLVHFGLISNESVNWIVSYLNYDVKNAMITWRDFLGFRVPMVYYKSVVLLIVSIAIMSEFSQKEMILYKKFLLYTFIFMLAISGTRTNMVVSFLILLLIFINQNGNAKKTSFIIFLSIPILLYLSIDLIFLKDTGENLVKSRNFIDYINLISLPKYILFGDGFGTLFYSSVHAENVLNTELVYLDIFRWFGILPGVLFLLFLLFPCYVFIVRKKLNLLGCYFGYFLIMGSNPLLLSSTGMFLVSYFFVKSILLFDFDTRKDFLRLNK